VYVGRGPEWAPNEFGNEFIIGKDGTREEVIEKFRQRLLADPVRVARVKEVLKGKNLVCWCAPKPCHADVLLEIANQPEEERRRPIKGGNPHDK
jgi:hypothetical protein